MNRPLVVAAIAAVLGWVLGWVLGATLGGNLATSVELAGTRGYEATGLIGGIVGASAAALLAARGAAGRG